VAVPVIVLAPQISPTGGATPEWTVLASVIGSHGDPKQAAARASAALGAIEGLDDHRGRIYADLVLMVLSRAARTALEGMMDLQSYRFQSDLMRQWQREAQAEGRQKGRQEGVELGRQEGVELGRQEGVELGRQEGVELGRQEGVQEGLILAVLQIFEARGVTLTDAQTAGIRACRDAEVLADWVRRALVESPGSLLKSQRD
jgi:hypothetical protein